MLIYFWNFLDRCKVFIFLQWWLDNEPFGNWNLLTRTNNRQTQNMYTLIFFVSVVKMLDICVCLFFCLFTSFTYETTECISVKFYFFPGGGGDVDIKRLQGNFILDFAKAQIELSVFSKMSAFLIKSKHMTKYFSHWDLWLDLTFCYCCEC